MHVLVHTRSLFQLDLSLSSAGHTVAVHGEVIVVGAYAANTVIPESGSAFSFRKNSTANSTSWTEKGTYLCCDICYNIREANILRHFFKL
jgi:hypothetical protein